MSNHLKGLKMTPRDKKVLADQVIDETKPGPILTDFETFLDFFGTDGAPVSLRRNFIPLKSLRDLNERMTRPIQTGLARPLQKSFPNINGLYLLLMSTGMAILKSKGKKPLMAIDETLLDKWRKLNAVEKYFTLLEAWLIKGQIRVIDERTMNSTILFRDWRDFSKAIPPKGLKVRGNKETLESLSYLPGLYAAALMDMFGLASVRQGPPVQGKAWPIDAIHNTPFGKALVKLLAPFFSSQEYFDIRIREEPCDFGILQDTVKPFFPEWEQNLEAVETPFKEGLYTFKASLGRVWRRIAIGGDRNFESLASTILNAFSFDHDHLYEFTFRSRHGVPENIAHPYVQDEPLSTTEVRIGEPGLAPGAKLSFLYDFGDNWQFSLDLESIDPDGDNRQGPAIIDARGDAPEQYPSWEDDEEYDDDDDDEY